MPTSVKAADLARNPFLIGQWTLRESAQHRFVALLLITYGLALFFPGVGIWMRNIELWSAPHGSVGLSQPLLALVLMLTGWHIDIADGHVAKRVNLAGLTLATWLIPCVSLGLVAVMLRRLSPSGTEISWGLVVVSAMPIAGSTVAWSGIGGGNVRLSLQLLVAATLSAPLISPFILYFGMQGGGAAATHAHLTNLSSFTFLVTWVVIPAVLGRVWGTSSSARSGKTTWQGIAKLCCTVVLLLLNYMNAAIAVPALWGKPRLATLIGATTIGACVTTHVFSLLIMPPSRSPQADRISFALAASMKNTGAAVVFAGFSLEKYPIAIATVVVYTLTQHVLAGIRLSKYDGRRAANY